MTAVGRGRGRPRTQGQAPRDVGARRLPRRGRRHRRPAWSDPGRGGRRPSRGPRAGRRVPARATPPFPAALAGAQVVASDLTPELFETGSAGGRGARCHARMAPGRRRGLPFDDAEFDVVLSCLGVMFAPHHQASADELVRVCRPGGTIGLLSWTPRGLHRADVRHHEAVRAAASARCSAAAAVGQRGARPRPARRSGDRRRGAPADPRRSSTSTRPRSSATTSRPTTARPSRLPQHRRRPGPGRRAGPRPRRPRSSLRHRRRQRPSWSGSTCSSRRASRGNTPAAPRDVLIV